MSQAAEIAQKLLSGERSAVARMITWAENADERFPEALQRIYSRVGRSWRLGVTGPPGAGKSTLVNELLGIFRGEDRTVGVLAVDPSSPFSGGALLGDRIRMEERTLDAGVFIRSMASRGSHGGIARATVDACDVMDAFGFDELVIETVGVGQAEYDVVSAADTIVVVLCPGAGDGIQAMKAGLLEVADVLVVNKADVSGAERLAADLEEAVHLRTAGKAEWIPPVVSCSAGTGSGVDAVLAAVEDHRAFLDGDRKRRSRKEKRGKQVERVVSERLDEAIWEHCGYRDDVEDLLGGGSTPYDVASRIVETLLGKIAGGGPRNVKKEAGRT